MSGECARSFLIQNQLGLHARAAAKLVKTASQFASQVTIERDGRRADAKSVMGVLLLCGQRGTEVRIVARGPDAEDAVSALGALIANRFGEDA